MKYAYARSVFVNCPFTDDFKPLFRAIIFTIVHCGYVPRCALEFEDSNHVRLQKIERLIEQSKFGIHDLSFMELDKHSSLPRFNMPLELGLFLGAKRYGDVVQKRKRLIILDKDKYRYQKAVSDISGQDIKCHYNKPSHVIKCLRNWLKTVSGRKHIPGARYITNRYKRYEQDLPNICKNLEYDFNDLPFNDFWETITIWLEQDTKKPA